MAIEIVDFPINSMVMFHSYLSKMVISHSYVNVYQRVVGPKQNAGYGLWIKIHGSVTQIRGPAILRDSESIRNGSCLRGNPMAQWFGVLDLLVLISWFEHNSTSKNKHQLLQFQCFQVVASHGQSWISCKNM
jgi:hypothetical protein